MLILDTFQDLSCLEPQNQKFQVSEGTNQVVFGQYNTIENTSSVETLAKTKKHTEIIEEPNVNTLAAKLQEDLNRSDNRAELYQTVDYIDKQVNQNVKAMLNHNQKLAKHLDHRIEDLSEELKETNIEQEIKEEESNFKEFGIDDLLTNTSEEALKKETEDFMQFMKHQSARTFVIINSLLSAREPPTASKCSSKSNN